MQSAVLAPREVSVLDKVGPSYTSMVDNLLANSMAWSAARPYAFRVEADFVTCTQ